MARHKMTIEEQIRGVKKALQKVKKEGLKKGLLKRLSNLERHRD